LKLILDSFAWVEFLSQGELGPQVEARFEQADQLLTPDIVLAEISRKFSKEGVELSTLATRLRAMIGLSDVVGVNIAIALKVPSADVDLRHRAQERRERTPSFADAIILATARDLGAKVLTGDPHFEGFPETEWLGA
jgi:predicted nucleic acid-binding protein